MGVLTTSNSRRRTSRAHISVPTSSVSSTLTTLHHVNQRRPHRPQLVLPVGSPRSLDLGLVSVATSSGSIVEPLTSYIEDLCTTTPCTASDLSGAKTIIDNGCSTDIANGSVIPTALELVIDNFGGVR